MTGGRRRAIERLRVTLGDDEVDTLIAAGAAMTYDEIMAFAIEQLGPVEANPEY